MQCRKYFFILWAQCFALIFSFAGKVKCDEVVYLHTTEAFVYAIKKSQFETLRSSDDVEYMPSVQGMPDLPNWMSYKYPNASRDAYLYGTPISDGDIDIEIIALNKHTYDTHRRTIKFSVSEKENKSRYEVEFKLANLNIEDFFVNNRVQDLLNIFLDRLWRESESVYTTMIAAPTDVGGRLPINPKEKEGVIVRIGSSDEFSRDLLDLEREVEPIKNRNPCPRKYKATSAEHLFRRKNFQIDWCSFHLSRILNENSTTEQDEQRKANIVSTSLTSIGDSRLFIEAVDTDNFNVNDEEPDEPRHKLMIRGRDHSTDLLYCGLIPLVVGFIVISTLSCVFFYKEQLEKFERQAPVEQMQQYETLQRVHSQMRQLAANRDILPSTPCSSLARLA